MSLRAPRRIQDDDDYVALVRAVLGASVEDENDWIEWKSDLDLTSKETKATIARNILGFANRDPEELNKKCGGAGVMVVGAEPGSLVGVDALDPAKLVPPIDAIVGGAGGPKWTHRYVGVDDRTVLVITVPPPRPASPIYPARRSSGSVVDGRIYIRKPGLTVQADSADIDMLQRRLTGAAVGRGIQVRVSGGPAIPADLPELIAAADRWCADVAAWQVKKAELAMPEPAAPGWLTTSVPDRRTMEEYLEEVADWKESAFDWAYNVILALATADRLPIVIEVIDSEERFHPEVEVQVRFDGMKVVDADEVEDPDEPPEPPAEFGQRHPMIFMPHSYGPLLNGPLYDGPPIPGPTHIAEDRCTVSLRVGDLRPAATWRSDKLFLFSVDSASTQTVEWRATFKGHDGAVGGTLAVAVASDPLEIDVERLLYKLVGERLGEEPQTT